MKYTRYVDANQYDAVKSKQNLMDRSVFERVEVEIKAVDMNYAFVPTGEQTQADKEGSENMRKTAECNAARFGLSNDGVASY